jgi:predicted nucleotidyltransferase
MATSAGALPPHVDKVLNDFVTAAQQTFGDRLSSIVLFGSAAENRLRATSDVNLLVVLNAFQQPDLSALAPTLRLARVAARLEVMFLLTAEIPDAMECFAQKFGDILHRHRVLVGPDPFGALAPSRASEIYRLRQVLFNLQLRLRQGFAERAGQDDRLALLIADFSGPLRTCAAALARLENKGDFSPKEALERFADSLAGPASSQAVRQLPAIRDGHAAETPDLSATLFTILDIVQQLRTRAGRLA